MTTIWNIDPTHSTIGFAVRHMFSKVRGRFLQHTGVIALEDDIARSSVEVTIEAASIDTGTAQRDAHLRSPDFFDADRFPRLWFRSKRVDDLGEGRLRVTGDLTIRDTTREVELDVEAMGRGTDPWGNERAGYLAKTAINREDFGLRWNQALEVGGLLVGDHVEIQLDVQAIKATTRELAPTAPPSRTEAGAGRAP